MIIVQFSENLTWFYKNVINFVLFGRAFCKGEIVVRATPNVSWFTFGWRKKKFFLLGKNAKDKTLPHIKEPLGP